MPRSALPKIATALAVGAAIALAPTAAFAQTMLDTSDNGSGGGYSPFGANAGSSTPTYGQVITAPATDTVLTSFSFEMNGSAAVVFRGEIRAWDGVKAVGPALYLGDPVSLQVGGGAFETVEFLTGGVQLAAGSTYVIAATTLSDPQVATGQMSWEASNEDYALGGLVYSNAATYAARDASAWDSGIQPTDFSFTAVFEEPIVAAGITPSTGGIAGGTVVTITGSNFDEATGVLFGGVAATSFVIDSDTQITAVAPAQAAGAVTVFVQGAGFATAAAPATTFTYSAPAAVVAAALPNTGFGGSALPLAALLLAAGMLAVTASRRGRRAVTA